ncbi:MAG: hypothetical protein Q7U74_09455, partial [Saprospiraceae bacterium]|nr:hypothetical protein [Saprospiraceae bacterium]
ANVKNISAMLEYLGLRVVREQLKQPQTNEEILSLYKELSQARKELADHKDEIRRLERLVWEHKKLHDNGPRSGDPNGLNHTSLRRQVNIEKLD